MNLRYKGAIKVESQGTSNIRGNGKNKREAQNREMGEGR